jgi:hypothetical protein
MDINIHVEMELDPHVDMDTHFGHEYGYGAGCTSVCERVHTFVHIYI